MKIIQLAFMVIGLSTIARAQDSKTLSPPHSSCPLLLQETTASLRQTWLQQQMQNLKKEYQAERTTSALYNQEVLKLNRMEARARVLEGFQEPRIAPSISSYFSDSEHSTQVLSFASDLVDSQGNMTRFSEGTTVVLEKGRVLAYQFAGSHRFLYTHRRNW